MNDIRLSAAQWREVCERLFRAWGAPDDIAACVARSLVEASLAGVNSHGVVRIGNYYRFIKPGWWLAASRPQIAREGPCTAIVDGNWGFGQPAMRMAVDVGIEKARAYGIAGIGVIRAGHIGRLGEYAEQAAAAGMIALMGTSNALHGGHVAPYGGAERVFSTNPMAAAVPAREHPPFLMDFATTVVAAGKLELAANKNVPIPEGWAIDREGRPATEARQYLEEGGAMLPFAGHKGYALMLLIELLAGALTGAGVTHRPEVVPTGGLGFGGNATFLIVLDVAHFTDVEQFGADVDGLFERLSGVKPAPGFQKVIVPGEPEAEQRAKRAREGISVDGVIWEQIVQIAAESQVSLADIRPEE
ncbi:MAG: Ldh family oxidoreductase [Chloroflexi bacterium]|nr:Ldh family oxidoreductase [Chloroflexota bacterium]